MPHLKRHMMPKTWKISRKEKTYAVCPSPGPHPKKNSIPLLVIVRDILKHAETGDEAKAIIKRGLVSVDGIVRKGHRYPAGFMDSIAIKGTAEHFRIMLGPNGLLLHKIEASDANRKLCIIRKKYTMKGNVQCISLHDGRVLLLGKEKTEYKPGETIEIEIPNRNIIGRFKIEKGANAMIISGKNMGIHGKIKEVRDRKFMTEKSTVILESGGKEIETLKEYVMATGSRKEGMK